MQRVSVTSHAVADQLRAQIAGGMLAPGAPLRQEAIAADLKVSRMPVRDALSQLHAEGLVDLYPNRGAFVATLSLNECAEIYDLRVLLECDALAHAVPRHTEKSLRKVAAIQRQLESEDETHLWADGDRRFHDALYEPCGRSRTLQMIGSLRNAVERFYLANLKHDDHRRGWKKEHRDILKAATDGNARRAAEQLREHLRATQKVVMNIIQAGER